MNQIEKKERKAALSMASSLFFQHQNQYRDYLTRQVDYQVTPLPISPVDVHINPHFAHLHEWISGYCGPGTVQLLALDQTNPPPSFQKPIPAIRDENRNAILPALSLVADGRRYYVSIKGCGAIEDMFLGGSLTLAGLQAACRNIQLVPRLSEITAFQGIIMAENWMGESPYGAQGEDNGFDELEFSRLATPFAIQGAYICPLIGLIRLPDCVETMARNFFWYRTYPKPFYQSIRLVPSRIRLYFESTEVMSRPGHIFSILGLETSEEIRQFEVNFIRSGIALLTLFTRSATLQDGIVRGLIYQDVWLDKDAILAIDGVIHFADLEGLIFKSIPLEEYQTLQQAEWQKLAFEFLYALNNLDRARRSHEGLSEEFNLQRQELGLLIQNALESDPIAQTSLHDNAMYISIYRPTFPKFEIPFLESIYFQ